MFAVLKSLSKTLSTPSRAERERDYLNAAVSLYDLECRERQIDHGLFRQMAFSH